MALEWIEYLETHARRVYGVLGGDAVDYSKARALADKIKEGQVPLSFTARDLYLKGWSGLTNPDDMARATRQLVELDWLFPGRINNGNKDGGRPTTRFSLSSRLAELIGEFKPAQVS
jgi:hypothetical protein